MPEGNLQILRRLVKRLDMYGSPISFNYHQNSTYQTLFGGIMTMITIVSIIILTFQGALALLSRSNSQVDVILKQIQAQAQYVFDPTATYINTSQFQLFLGLSQGWSFNDELDQLKISIQVVHLKENRISHSNIVQTQICSSDGHHIFNGLDYSSQLKDMNLSATLCLKPHQRLQLKGRYRGSDYSYLKISVLQSQTQKSEIRDTFSKNPPQVWLAFTNSFLDQEGSLLKPVLQQTSKQLLDLNKITQVNIPIEKTTFNDDRSIIPRFEDIHHKVFLNAIPEPQSNYRVRNNEKELLTFQIYLSQYEHYVYKSYDKIDRYLAYVGGIIQIVSLVLGYFIQGYNKYAFYVSLANKLYTFDLQPSKGETYGRQNTDREENFLTIDQIRKRLRSRIKTINLSISQHQKGGQGLLNKEQVIMMLMQKHSVSLHSPEQRKEQDYVIQDHVWFNNPKIIAENESESVSSPRQEPQAQQIKIMPIYNTNFFQKSLRSSPNSSSNYKYSRHQGTNIDQKIEIDFSDRKTFLKQSFKDILKYTKQIKMSGLYMVTQIFCRKLFFRKHETIQLLDKAISMLKYDTDLVNILDKLQDIDKLKRIILNEDQQVVFNYTPKPIVKARRTLRRSLLQFETQINEHLDEMSQQVQLKEQSLLQSKKQFYNIKSFFKLFKAYENLNHRQQILSKVEIQFNSRLMLLIGQDLREVFEVSQYLEDHPEEQEKQIINNDGESVVSQASIQSMQKKSTLQLSGFAKQSSQKRKILIT